MGCLSGRLLRAFFRAQKALMPLNAFLGLRACFQPCGIGLIQSLPRCTFPSGNLFQCLKGLFTLSLKLGASLVRQKSGGRLGMGCPVLSQTSCRGLKTAVQICLGFFQNIQALPPFCEGSALEFHRQTCILKLRKSVCFSLSGILSLTDGDINLLAQVLKNIIVRPVFLQRSQFCFKCLKSPCLSIKSRRQSIQSAFQPIAADGFCISQTDCFFQRRGLSAFERCELVLLFGGLSALFRKLGVFLFLSLKISEGSCVGSLIL
ncbi:hypothetical protein NBRC3257_2397 [Gluconobacter thailandicus NBRC 3257]|uniref:Uncharacterized protein n=1 Tax=Gluconobacter thailandicus NBRC 3257 TaxID=1381097 RepID=A0ABQ0IYY6_GLUTH|nr:hypothetical protein NBRC3255_0742 [Gluconobacter thailandicus NBRC 3255]GAD27398.1 hypothetical protein NBRC3257_2397 [Gluconobacter thailandicus NBRC 3257]